MRRPHRGLARWLRWWEVRRRRSRIAEWGVSLQPTLSTCTCRVYTHGRVRDFVTTSLFPRISFLDYANLVLYHSFIYRRGCRIVCVVALHLPVSSSSSSRVIPRFNKQALTCRWLHALCVYIQNEEFKKFDTQLWKRQMSQKNFISNIFIYAPFAPFERWLFIISFIEFSSKSCFTHTHTQTHNRLTP